ncbi:sugar transferase [Taibaiella chishuiensis]|uniref:Exopolysaccharide biosynthesis polyprenyl glycosylphosphotransferase n=1 Tax=Taibaiella chishuiensis TaxID=1434707 RepID=A0A2P8D094_9BACT|nr:sugar transferase [Taibaiella chishuiensis]PSK90635.1 exopolysaccharide biosynthesis polyprenyl glycosylphosphotransferase [Taibaiella chishuiensis]
MKLSAAKRNAIIVLVVLDYLTAIAAWLVFWLYRQSILHGAFPDIYPYERNWTSRDYILSFVVVPSCWIFLHYLCGTYFDLYRKSRLLEIYRSLIASIIGATILGLLAFANDTDSFKYFFEITMWYFLTHVVFLLTARLIWLYKIKLDLQKEKVGYNTLIVGGNGKATRIYNELKNNPHVLGNIVKGFVNADHISAPLNIPNVPELGSIDNLEEIIDKYQIEEVVIAVESYERVKLEHLLTRLSYRPVIVKVLPDLYDIISGSVRISNVYAPVLISIHPELLPDWQKVCKRVLDLAVALISLILLSPVYLLAAIKVRLSSSGPIIYKQERVGLFGRPFNIYKFRSMLVNAEDAGPALSSDNDSRITNWGKVMRKWRIDELPQFVNILKGDMSLVGPRPERKYYIDKITPSHPHYKYLHRVKPGITSWGMVQYGYAENIEQMTERMKYDLLYIENCSIALDIKIMIYTINVIFQGRGK